MLHRHARPAVAGSFVSGALVGALMTATGLLLLAGLASPVPSIARGMIASVFLAALVAHQAGLVRLPLPQRAHQIPQEVFHQRPSAAARRFAFELGTGVRTYVTSAAPYGLAVVLILTMPDRLGPALFSTLLAAIGFGLGRSIIIASHAWRPKVAVDHPAIWLRLAAFTSLAASVSLAVRTVVAA